MNTRRTPLSPQIFQPRTPYHRSHLAHSSFASLSFFPLFSSYIYHLVNDLPSLKQTTLSVLESFAADGVVYLELRTTPRALPRSSLSKADYVEAILDTISDFELRADKMHTRLILSVDRRNTPAEAAETIALARRFRRRGVVGVDLCGDPSRGGIEVLQPAFEQARRSSSPSGTAQDGEDGRTGGEDVPLGVTLHFAEAEASGSDEELLMLLRAWRPDRIGHVIHVSDAVRREIIAARRPGAGGGLGLELCLSCNVHAGMVSGGFEGHHFGQWCKSGHIMTASCELCWLTVYFPFFAHREGG